MLRWGDRWLSGDDPPLILTHHGCGMDFAPTVVCNHCRAALKASDMSYQLNYRSKDDGRPRKAGRPLAVAGT
jgi:hypothetical protein